MYKKSFRFKKIVLFGVVVFALLSSKVVACQNLQKNQQLERKLKDVKLFKYFRENRQFNSDTQRRAAQLLEKVEEAKEINEFRFNMLHPKYMKLHKMMCARRLSPEGKILEERQRCREELQRQRKARQKKAESVKFTEEHCETHVAKSLRKKNLAKKTAQQTGKKTKFSAKQQRDIVFKKCARRASLDANFHENLRMQALKLLKEAEEESEKNSPERVSFLLFRAKETYSLYMQARILNLKVRKLKFVPCDDDPLRRFAAQKVVPRGKTLKEKWQEAHARKIPINLNDLFERQAREQRKWRKLSMFLKL